jgi:hypothetical protein
VVSSDAPPVAPAAAVGTEAGAAAAPARGSRGARAWIVSGLVIVVVALTAITVILIRNHGSDPLSKIVVGDCVDSSQYEPELGSIPAKPTVGCDDPKATHKVVGIVDGQNATSLEDDSICASWPQTTATIWLGEHDKSGKIFCLADLGR